MQKTQRYQETLQDNGGKSRITLYEDKKKTKEEHTKFYICTILTTPTPCKIKIKFSFFHPFEKFFLPPEVDTQFFHGNNFLWQTLPIATIPHGDNF